MEFRKNGTDVSISRAGIRDADIENGHVDTAGMKDELGNWDIYIYMYMYICMYTHRHYHHYHV